MDTFGVRLQRLRKARNLTLEALASQIGSTKSYVWDLENKPTIRPSADLAHRLAVALDTTVGVLMGDASPDDAPERDQVFFRNYQRLNSDTKLRLSRIMDALMEIDDDDEEQNP